MNVSYLHPIFCKGINKLKHTNLSKVYVKSLYKVSVELPLFFSMASEGMIVKAMWLLEPKGPPWIFMNYSDVTDKGLTP